jgi:hypothetical protein
MKQSNGNTRISLVTTDTGTILFSVSGPKPTKLRNNIYDALSDYGVGYNAAKQIVKLFLKQELPDFRVNLLKDDFKGYESETNKEDE